MSDLYKGAMHAVWRVLEKHGPTSPALLVGNDLKILRAMHLERLKLSYTEADLVGKPFAYLSTIGFLDPALQSLAYRITRMEMFPDTLDIDRAQLEYDGIRAKFGLHKMQAQLEEEVRTLLKGGEIRTEHSGKLLIREKDGSRRKLPLNMWHFSDNGYHAGSYAMLAETGWFMKRVEGVKDFVTALIEPGFPFHKVTDDFVLAISKFGSEENERILAVLKKESERCKTIVLDFLGFDAPERTPLEGFLYSLARPDYCNHAENGKLVIGNPTKHTQSIVEKYLEILSVDEEIKKKKIDLSKYVSFNTLQMPEVKKGGKVISSFAELEVNIAEEFERLRKNEPSFTIDSVPKESVQGVQESSKGQGDVLPGAGENTKQ